MQGRCLSVNWAGNKCEVERSNHLLSASWAISQSIARGVAMGIFAMGIDFVSFTGDANHSCGMARGDKGLTKTWKYLCTGE